MQRFTFDKLKEQGMLYNVRDFSAKGDGVTLDTGAIQQAIDSVAGSGEAGTVLLPQGRYIIGTINLVSNLTLRLEAGACLIGSKDISDYIETDIDPCTSLKCGMICGFNLENVIIEGEGVIDGSGDAFWYDEYLNGKSKSENTYSHAKLISTPLKPYDKRTVILMFSECNNLKIRGVTITNASGYTVWPVGCKHVYIENVTIKNNRQGPNTDALDIDSCSDVFVNNCHIDAGDDCIALKTSHNRLKKPQPCERVCVTNCILSSPTCAIRIGYEGDMEIKDCIFSDLIIYDSRNGINLLSIATSCSHINLVKGTEISRMNFNNIIMQNVAHPIFIWAGDESIKKTYCAQIRDIKISNISAEAIDGAFIGTEIPGVIKNITLDNITVNVKRIKQAPEKFIFPNVFGGGSPNGLDIIGVKNVNLHNVEINGGKVNWEKNENITLDHKKVVSKKERQQKHRLPAVFKV